MILGIGLWTFLRALFTGAPAAALENLALRHQFLVLRRSVPRPRLARWDRVPLGLNVSGLGGLAIQSRHRAVCDGSGGGRPGRTRSAARGSTPRFCQLIRRLARENLTWGRRRTHAKLALVGYAESAWHGRRAKR